MVRRENRYELATMPEGVETKSYTCKLQQTRGLRDSSKGPQERGRKDAVSKKPCSPRADEAGTREGRSQSEPFLNNSLSSPW